jgi:hypothetical protein
MAIDSIFFFFTPTEIRGNVVCRINLARGFAVFRCATTMIWGVVVCCIATALPSIVVHCAAH